MSDPSAYVEHLPPIEEEQSGFMCQTDFECELYNARGGIKVYSSIGDLVESRPCVRQCGIVQVQVRLMKVLREADYDLPMEGEG